MEFVTGYDVTLSVAAPDRAGLELLLASLPGVWRRAAPHGVDRVYSLGRDARGAYVLRVDGDELERTSHLEHVVEMLVGSVGFYAADSSRKRTFVHAGAVGWRGRAIVVPGRPGTGKTTLTAALVRAGARYLSDEYAPIDDGGIVHPFPRPLSIRRENDRRPRLERVEAIGGTAQKQPLPVGLVIVTAYGPVKRWRPRRMAPGEALLELLKHTVSGQTRPHEALERLGVVTTGAPVLKGRRGEADEVAPLILRRLEGPAAPPIAIKTVAR